MTLEFDTESDIIGYNQTQKYIYIYIYREREREREGERKKARERERGHMQLYWLLRQSRSNLVPLHFQEIFTIITTNYKMLKDTTKRLPILKYTTKRLSNA